MTQAHHNNAKRRGPVPLQARHQQEQHSDVPGTSSPTTTAKYEAPEKSGRDAPAPPTTRTTGPRGAPPETTPIRRGKADSLPSWLDYCFEYEAVSTGSANKDNNTACLNSLVTVVRIQGDVPSRRRNSRMDAATLLEGEAIGLPLLRSGIENTCSGIGSASETEKPRCYASSWGSATLNAFARLPRAFSALRVDIAACSKDLPVFCRVPARA